MRGILRERMYDTAAAIARVQASNGAIPDMPGGTIDLWNHVEAAMALDAGGLHAAAEQAYRWCLATQGPSGAWPAVVTDDAVVDGTLDANFTAYVAAGIWHHYLSTRDDDFVDRAWPHIERAIGFVVDLQLPSGAIAWARDPQHRPWPGALVTSSACIALSLRCAIRAAVLVGEEQPDWELALVSLEDALRDPQTPFESKDRFAMDWYYPVLSGALDAATGRDLLRARWDEFVLEGYGSRCVSDRPWVTAGETAELVLACDACGMEEEARALFEWVQHLRADDGAYWIGATQPDGTVWPREKPTWGSGSVILAADALYGSGPTSSFFRESLGRHSDPVGDAL